MNKEFKGTAQLVDTAAGRVVESSMFARDKGTGRSSEISKDSCFLSKFLRSKEVSPPPYSLPQRSTEENKVSPEKVVSGNEPNSHSSSVKENPASQERTTP